MLQEGGVAEGASGNGFSHAVENSRGRFATITY